MIDLELDLDRFNVIIQMCIEEKKTFSTYNKKTTNVLLILIVKALHAL